MSRCISHTRPPTRRAIAPWFLGSLLLTGIPLAAGAGQVQESMLVPDRTLPIPELRFDSNGALVIDASATSSQHDFDYLVGNWKLHNRRLKSRLSNSDEWTAVFESRTQMHKVLNGVGNIDMYMENRDGKPFEGMAVRLFDTRTRLWSIYWADGSVGRFDPPVVGSFENKVGHFFGRDTYQGRNIIVVFRWDVRNPELPVWSQAFSTDEGRTWEWNMINVSERVQ